MYVTVETDVDLEYYIDDIIYMLKNKKHLREKVFSDLEGTLQTSSGKTIVIVDDDIRCRNLQKLLHNFWKLTSEEDTIISDLADRF
jgi:3-polyprenyl-4-hydroxybenzoate decarboxylase